MSLKNKYKDVEKAAAGMRPPTCVQTSAAPSAARARDTAGLGAPELFSLPPYQLLGSIPKKNTCQRLPSVTGGR